MSVNLTGSLFTLLFGGGGFGVAAKLGDTNSVK